MLGDVIVRGGDAAFDRERIAPTLGGRKVARDLPVFRLGDAGEKPRAGALAKLGVGREVRITVHYCRRWCTQNRASRRRTSRDSVLAGWLSDRRCDWPRPRACS